MASLVGRTAHATKTFTALEDVVFAYLSGDRNRPLWDAEHATGTHCERLLVHATLTASLFTTVCAEAAPGAVYRSCTLEFLHPVFPGEAVTAEAIVRADEAGSIHVEVRARNGQQKVVIAGEVRMRRLIDADDAPSVTADLSGSVTRLPNGPRTRMAVWDTEDERPTARGRDRHATVADRLVLRTHAA